MTTTHNKLSYTECIMETQHTPVVTDRHQLYVSHHTRLHLISNGGMKDDLTCITDSSLLESVSEFSGALIALGSICISIFNALKGVNPSERCVCTGKGGESSQPGAGCVTELTKSRRRGTVRVHPVASSSGTGRHRLRTAGLGGFKTHTPPAPPPL